MAKPVLVKIGELLSDGEIAGSNDRFADSAAGGRQYDCFLGRDFPAQLF
jgi:hypothetical protein